MFSNQDGSLSSQSPNVAQMDEIFEHQLNWANISELAYLKQQIEQGEYEHFVDS